MIFCGKTEGGPEKDEILIKFRNIAKIAKLGDAMASKTSYSGEWLDVTLVTDNKCEDMLNSKRICS